MRSYYSSYSKDQNGRVIASATVSVYLAGTTTAANVYTTLTGTAAVNSVTSDSTGKFEFYVSRFDYDIGQQFKLVVSKAVSTVASYATVTHDYIDVVNHILTTYTISDNTTVTTDLGYVPKGVIYSVASGKTLTIKGPFSAGMYQVFTGSGTVTFGAGSVDFVHPEWWATNTAPGTTDMGAAIQSALNSYPIVALAATTYKTTIALNLRQDLLTSYSVTGNYSTRLTGQGMRNTNIDASTVTGPVITATGVHGLRDAYIVDFRIIGNTASGTNNLMEFRTGLHRTTIERVWFYSAGLNGIYIEALIGPLVGAYYNKISSCIFGNTEDFSAGDSNTAKIRGSGIYAVGSVNRMTVSDNQFWRVFGHGIYVGGESDSWVATNWTIENNGIEACGYYNTTTNKAGVFIGNYFIGNMNILGNYIENITSAAAYKHFGIYSQFYATDLNIEGNFFALNDYDMNIDEANSANIRGNSFAGEAKLYSILVNATSSLSKGLINIGANSFSPATTYTGKFLSTTSPTRIIGDPDSAYKSGSSCLMGTFTPRLYGGTTEITVTSATASYRKVGRRLTIRFYMEISNLNGATAQIRIAGAGGYTAAMPFQYVDAGGGTISLLYPFLNDSTIAPLANLGAVYLSLVNMGAGYTYAQIQANQTGAFYAYIRLCGNNVAATDLLASACQVGTIIAGEFTVIV